MSTLNLDALGLQPDPGDTPAAPAAAPAAPAAPQSVTGIPAQPAAPEAAPVIPEVPAVEPDEEIEVPEGAENPDAVKSLISAERKAAREAYKRAREAEAKLAAITEAAMPAEERIRLATERAAAAELKATKLEVGLELGLPKTFAELLQGSDRQSLETHAKAVLSELQSRTAAPTAVPAPPLRGSDTPPPAAPVDPGKGHNNFLLGLMGQRPGA